MSRDQDNTNSGNQRPVITVALVEQAKEDRYAFSLIYKSLYQGIYRFILNRTKRKEDAEDLVNEAFLRGYTKLIKGEFREEGGPSPEDKSSFREFLFTIAIHLVIGDSRKARRRKIISLEGMDLSSGNDPEEIASENQKKSILRAKINNLSTIHRDIIELFYYENFTFKEIANILEIPYWKVLRDHKAAKDSLAKQLDGLRQ